MIMRQGKFASAYARVMALVGGGLALTVVLMLLSSLPGPTALAEPSIVSVSPSYVSVNGGAEITITVDGLATLPAQVDESWYVRDGLVVLLDGHKNNGTDFSSSVSTWVDLSGNGNNATLTGQTWQADYAVKFSGSSSGGTLPNFTIPASASQEFVIKSNRSESILFINASGTHAVGPYSNGFIATAGTNGAVFVVPSGSPLDTGEIFSLSRTQTDSVSNVSLNLNNAALARTGAANNWNLNGTLANYIGRRGNGTYSYSQYMYNVRLYDRVLTSDERTCNYGVDRVLYMGASVIEAQSDLAACEGLLMPTVSVGGVDCPATSFLGDKITCTVPAHTAGLVDVVVSGLDGEKVTLAGAFNYRGVEIDDVDSDHGQLAGGERITITGAGFTDYTDVISAGYVQSGLMAHLDGIYNQDYGVHAAAPATWADLSGNGNDLALHNATWSGNGVVFNGASTYGEFPLSLAIPAQATIEIVQKTTRTSGIVFSDASAIHSMGYYTVDNAYIADTSSSVGKTFIFPTGSAIDTGALFTLAYRADSPPSSVRLSLDGADLARTGPDDLWTLSGTSLANYVGRRAMVNSTSQMWFKGEIYAIRIYDRILSDEEVAQNTLADQWRFIDDVLAPLVKIGGANCVDVVVVSDTSLNCIVPAGDAAGSVDVSVAVGNSMATLAGGYTYVDGDAVALSLGKTTVSLSGSPGVLMADYLAANVKTYNSTGYSLGIKASEPRLKCSASDDYIEPLGSSGAMVDNHWGYAVDDGSLSAPSSWTGVTTSSVVFKASGAATDQTYGDDTMLWLGAQANYSLPACDYGGVVTVSAVGN